MIGKATVFVALVLTAWAASLTHTDARPRGGKHVPNGGHHVGVHHPAGGAGVKARPSVPQLVREPAAFAKKNAIGATAPPAGMSAPKPGLATIPGGNAAGLTKSTPIGARSGAVAIPSLPAGGAKIGPAAGPTTFVRSAAPTLAPHPGGISGTGVVRPGTAPGVVGGPAKLAGGISGTGMKPKR
jgi:hypothetical protein